MPQPDKICKSMLAAYQKPLCFSYNEKHRGFVLSQIVGTEEEI